MIKSIQQWDESLFIYFNSFHSPFWDPLVFQLTQTITWVPFYIFLGILIIINFKDSWWWILIAVGLTILFADQTASGFMKPFFERLRPCQDPRWDGLIHNYRSCGGMYGFVSSHASNSFAVATIMNMTLGKKVRYLGWMFLWAALFSYTRIYLGVHYPADIIGGALVGMISAWLAVKIVSGVRQKFFGKSLLG